MEQKKINSYFVKRNQVIEGSQNILAVLDQDGENNTNFFFILLTKSYTLLF